MMSSVNEEKSDRKGAIKVGFGAGLVAGCALFSSFLSIDQQLNIPHGTFYKTIGIPMGVEGFGAVMIGLMMHITVAAIILIITSGKVNISLSNLARALDIIYRANPNLSSNQITSKNLKPEL